MHKQQGWPQAWEYCQAKLIQTLGRASQGVDWSWRLTRLQEKGYQATSETETTSEASYLGYKEKKNRTVAQCSKVLFSDESKFCISFGNQGLESGGRQERHRIQAAWIPVWSFWSQWWFGVPWCLLVLVHCVLSSPKSMQPSTRRFWSTLCFHLLTSFMEMLISFSSRTWHLPTLPKPLPSALLTIKLLCLIGQPTCLTWTPYGIYGIFSRERWETVDPTIQTSWRLNSASTVPQADCFHATSHWCWSLC